MAKTSMTLSFSESRIVREMRADALVSLVAGQESQAGHMLSAGMAYIRSLAASASGSDPDNLTWKQVAVVMNQGHQDVAFLGQLDLDRASAMGNVELAKHDLAFSSMLASKVEPSFTAKI